MKEIPVSMGDSFIKLCGTIPRSDCAAQLRAIADRIESDETLDIRIDMESIIDVVYASSIDDPLPRPQGRRLVIEERF